MRIFKSNDILVEEYCQKNDLPLRRIVKEYSIIDRKFLTILYKWECNSSLWITRFEEKRYIIDDVGFDLSYVNKELENKISISLDKQYIGTNLVNTYQQIITQNLKNGFEKALIKKDSLIEQAKHILRRSGLLHLNELKKEVAEQSATIPKKVLEKLFLDTLNEFTFDELKTGGVETPLLPKNCIYYNRNKSKELFVMEYQPMQRSIKIDNTLANLVNDNGKLYKLSFPWTLFLVEMDGGNFTSISCFMRTSKLKSFSEHVYHPLIANYWSKHDNKITSKVCTGGVILQSKSIHEKIEEVISQFWSSTFNKDLSDNIINFMKNNKLMNSFSKWEKSSIDNPHFVLELKLVSYESSLEKILNTEYLSKTDRTSESVEKLRSKLFNHLMEKSSNIQNLLLRNIANLQLSVNDEYLQKDFISKYREMVDEIISQVTVKINSIQDAKVDDEVWANLEHLIAEKGKEIFDQILNQLNATDESLFQKASNY